MSSNGSGEQPDNDLRELEFKKNQYGPRGETIALRYQRGLFLPVAGNSPLEKIAAKQRADELFLTMLGQFERAGRNVSDKPNAGAYAPRTFADENTAGVKIKEFEAAMKRLFAGNKIHVENYGRPSRPYTKLAIGAGVQVPV
jgi:RecA-family ATPase